MLEHVQLRKHRLHQPIAVLVPEAFALTGTAYETLAARLGSEHIEFSPIDGFATRSCAHQGDEKLARSVDVQVPLARRSRVPEEMGDARRGNHEPSRAKSRPDRADENLEFTVEDVEGVRVLFVEVRVVTVPRLHNALEQSELAPIGSQRGASAELLALSRAADDGLSTSRHDSGSNGSA
jgi:hypothetical protein